jgi:peptidoglycan/LPS O-acetylase OafA/YrhL
LEALRGFAALHVLLNHVSNSYLHLQHSFWALPLRFGQEGVLIFFLLSGFVICYSHHRAAAGGDGFRIYFFKRGRRIYPIFLLALLLAYGIACLGAQDWAPVNFRQLFGNIFMLQDHTDRPGVFCLPFADNQPLWSLSFEWWFYMMFYLVLLLSITTSFG